MHRSGTTTRPAKPRSDVASREPPHAFQACAAVSRVSREGPRPGRPSGSKDAAHRGGARQPCGLPLTRRPLRSLEAGEGAGAPLQLRRDQPVEGLRNTHSAAMVTSDNGPAVLPAPEHPVAVLRSQPKALAVLASHAMALRATLDSDLSRRDHGACRRTGQIALFPDEAQVFDARHARPVV